MSFDLNGFNANDYPDYVPVIEPGTYLAALVASEARPTKKDPSVKYLYLKFQILDGKFQGKPLEDRLNIQHADEQVRQISKQRLAGLCKAVGVVNPKSSEDLHNKPFGLIVKVADDEYNGEKRKVNKIAGFISHAKYREGQQAGAAKQQTAPAWMQQQQQGA